MDESKRRFLKLLPIAAVASVGIVKAAGVEGEVIEVSPSKRYILRVNREDLAQGDLTRLRQTLNDRGFPDMLVVSGDVELFEIT